MLFRSGVRCCCLLWFVVLLLDDVIQRCVLLVFPSHDTSIVLGSTRAGTLKLTEDERGLLVEASLPDTQAGRDAATLIKRGDVTGFSFSFRVPVGGDEWPNAGSVF